MRAGPGGELSPLARKSSSHRTPEYVKIRVNQEPNQELEPKAKALGTMWCSLRVTQGYPQGRSKTQFSP